jgi:hypothetical protein
MEPLTTWVRVISPAGPRTPEQIAALMTEWEQD